MEFALFVLVTVVGFLIARDFREQRNKKLSIEFRSVLFLDFWRDDKRPIRPEIDALVERGLDFEDGFKKHFQDAVRFGSSRVMEALLLYHHEKRFQLIEADAKSITIFTIEELGNKALVWHGEREEEAREFYQDLRKKFNLLIDFGFDLTGEQIVSAARYALSRAKAPLRAHVKDGAGIDMVADYYDPDCAHPLHVALMTDILEDILKANFMSTKDIG